MKVALVLYGFFRTFDFCKNSMQKHLIDVLNPDIFINTPDTIYTQPEHEVTEFHSFYSRNSEKTLDKVLFFHKTLKSLNIRSYNSQFYKDYISNYNIDIQNNIGQYTWRIASTLDSISSSVKSFQEHLIKNNTYYDLVILTRPDLRYYKDFNLHVLDMDKINYPAYHMCEPSNPSLQHLPIEQRKEVDVRIRKGGAGIFGYPGQWFNDQIICGNQDNIIKLANIFDNLHAYYQEGIFLNTETYLGVHCMKNNINFIDTDFTTYEMWRSDKPEY